MPTLKAYASRMIPILEKHLHLGGGVHQICRARLSPPAACAVAISIGTTRSAQPDN